ncbi:MAG: glycosyltransferase family 2 protein [Desulfovibrio sp.]|jgi:glycosyltransferase involved in cell wall biosynthesis|nr:glycosyltransferase family 2 protein [Desulfovibrio sp.]
MAAGAESPSFALLLTTRGRRHELVRLFDSLTFQTYRNFTLYVGDQNAPGVLDDILGLYADSLPVKRFMLQPTGLSRARNALLPHVREDIVAVPDDDCRYLKDTLERCAEAFTGYPHVDAFIGRWAECAPRAGGAAEPRPVQRTYGLFRRAPSITLFFRKKIFDVLRFDESIGIGSPSRFQSGEDTDLLLRAYARGFVIARMSSVVVRHDNGFADTPAALEKIRRYAAGRMALLRRHRLPLWFRLVNIVYPLAALPGDCARESLRAARCRWAMFCGRAAALRPDGAL